MVEGGSGVPPELELPEVPMSLDFHPSANVLAVGLIDGSVRASCFDGVEAGSHADPFLAIRPFNGSCRAVRFSADGSQLFAASADHSILALSPSGDIVWRQPNAHRDAVKCLAVVGDGGGGEGEGHGADLLASGDDSGAVKIWDVRQPERAVAGFDVFQDYVSAIYCDPPHGPHPNDLLATSGDGTLACFDLRQQRVVGRSTELEEDILSLSVIKGGRKVVCGSSEGVVLIFSWGNWDGATDSFPGHPQSIDAMLRLDEDTILTGSSDGLIRVVGIMPSKLYGLVGDHNGFPLEHMRWSGDRRLIGSISHDSAVRFWDVGFLHDDDECQEDSDGVDGDEEELTGGIGGGAGGEGGGEKSRRGKKSKKRKGKKNTAGVANAIDDESDAGGNGMDASDDQTSEEVLGHLRARQRQIDVARAAAAAAGATFEDSRNDMHEEGYGDEEHGETAESDMEPATGGSDGSCMSSKFKTASASFFSDI